LPYFTRYNSCLVYWKFMGRRAFSNKFYRIWCKHGYMIYEPQFL
jgi:hypothetical protein